MSSKPNSAAPGDRRLGLNRRLFLRAAAGAGCVIRASAQHHETPPMPGPDEVLRELTAGNARFAAGKASHPRATLDRVHEVAVGQHPRAVVLTCSDSRVPPETLFDQGIGDLFVVRVAGNVANNDQIASSEYAIEHFGSTLLVVLGHSQCGAVTAVVNGEKVSADIQHMVMHIGEAVERVRKEHPGLKGPELLAESVRANVNESIADLQRSSGVIAGRVREGKLKIVGGVYNLDDGKVNWTA